MNTSQHKRFRLRTTALFAGSLLGAGLLGGCMAAPADSAGGSAGIDGEASGGDDGGDDGGDPGSIPGVGQGGAQDFGQFRAILEAGGIPGPETLDDVGFFNEHKIAFGEPDCGDDVCLHGELGVMGNMINGSNCTLVLMGMNTPIDPDTIERPPLNLAVAIDTSGSMQGEPIEYVREGLLRMADALQPDDRVTLITFDDDATVEVDYGAGDSTAFEVAVSSIQAGGQTNIYAGLRRAYEAVAANVDPARQNRVILLSDGEATAGLLNDDRILRMAETYGAAGFGLSTIGVGDEFDPDLMRGLAENGSGAFYFLEDPAAVVEVFEEEVTAFLVPLAMDVTIDVDIAPGYSMRALYGTKRFELGPGSAHIDIPILQLAHRETADDNDGGRRGGGGALIAELVGDPEAVGTDGLVGDLRLTYRVPHTDETVEQLVDITSPHAPGETPDDGHFTSDGAAKAFVMLNLYAGFSMAAERASVGDDRGALSVLQALRPAVAAWVAESGDPDIEDDLRYVDMFVDNLRARGAEDPPPNQNPPEPWPKD